MWSTFHSMAMVSSLASGASYRVFPTGVQPDWEDARNAAGGRFVLTTDDLDEAWMLLLLGVLGESTFEDGLVTGVVASAKKQGTRLELWTSKTDPEAVVRAHARR
jgi:translation initiation factor 4E